jgi:hypothetical protein
MSPINVKQIIPIKDKNELPAIVPKTFQFVEYNNYFTKKIVKFE